MAYIKKNVNTFLLLLVVVIVGAIAGLSTYYQTTYKSLSGDYEDKLNEISGLVVDLNTKNEKLEKTEGELQVKKQREEELSTHYGEVKEEKDKLQGDLSTTRATLEDTTGKLKRKTTELNKALYDLNVATEEIADLKGQVKKFKSEAATFKSSWKSCESRLNTLEGN